MINKSVNIKPANRAQLEFLKSVEPMKIFIGGIGSGKTFAGAINILNMPAGSSGLVVSPTYRLMKDSCVKTVDQIFGKLGIIKYSNKQELRYILKNNTEFIFRSAQNPDETLIGSNVGWVWLDEGAYMSQYAYEKSLGRMRLSPEKLWITTSPNGFNYIYELTQKHKVYKATTMENPHLSLEYIKRLKSQYTSDYAKQELEAEFIELGVTLFRQNWLKYTDMLNISSYDKIVCGVDLAISQKSNADYTAMVVVGKILDKYHILDIYRERLTFNDTIEMLKKINEKYNCKFLIEQVAYQASIVQELKRTTNLSIQAVTPNRDKVTRTMPVAAKFELGLVSVNNNISERIKNLFEKELFSFPESEHDDMIDAMSYAINDLTKSYIMRSLRD